MKLKEALDALGAEVIYQAYPKAPAERGALTGVNGINHAMVCYGNGEYAQVKATPLNRLKFAHRLGKMIKLHRPSSTSPRPTICEDSTCARRHDWKQRCSCGETFYTGKLKYTRERARAHQCGREYKPEYT